MNHNMITETILFSLVFMLEVMSVLLYGLFVNVYKMEAKFTVIVVIVTIAKLIPNLIVFLSLFRSIKKLLLTTILFTLNLRFLIPFKKDILFFILLRTVEYLVYHVEEYMLYFFVYLINIYNHNNIEILENTYKLANLLFLLYVMLSNTTCNVIFDYCINFILCNS